jgi:hypothetical protein
VTSHEETDYRQAIKPFTETINEVDAKSLIFIVFFGNELIKRRREETAMAQVFHNQAQIRRWLLLSCQSTIGG